MYCTSISGNEIRFGGGGAGRVGVIGVVVLLFDSGVLAFGLGKGLGRGFGFLSSLAMMNKKT